MLEITHLNTLLAIADYGSFSRAADELGITQSAVSQNIKRLETKVGIPLVTKTAKITSLTTEGSKLADLARDFFKKMENALEEIQSTQHSMTGEIKVGTLMGFGKSWVAPKVIEFSQFFPDLTIKLQMDYPEVLVKAFEEHKIDALILPGSHIPAFVDAIKLTEEKTTLVIPNSYEIPESGLLDYKELSNFPLISFQDRDPLFYNWCKVIYGVLPKVTKSRIVMNSFGHILQAVSQGLGMAVIPTHVLDHYKHMAGSYKTLGTKYEVTTNEVFFAMQMGGGNHHRLKTLLDFFKKK